MVEVYETRAGVTKQIHPTTRDNVDLHATDPFTHLVAIKVVKERLFELPLSDRVLPLVWDTEALEYIAYVPPQTEESDIADQIIQMFKEWQCDINVHIMWLD